MERDFENRYHHGSPGSGNRHSEERRNDLRDGDFGREYENRYRSNDGRNRMSYDAYKSYNKWAKSSIPAWDERRAQRRYGGSDSTGGYGYDSDRNGNDRTPGRREQGGYGTGHMGGYSGSGFGGSNYSSHGNFSGNSEYGSMSGGGGNMSLGASSSGYGNKNSFTDHSMPNNEQGRTREDSDLKRSYDSSDYRNSAGPVNYKNTNVENNRTYGSSVDNSGGNRPMLNDSYKGYGSNNNRNGADNSERNYDRGGYYNYDPNNR